MRKKLPPFTPLYDAVMQRPDLSLEEAVVLCDIIRAQSSGGQYFKSYATIGKMIRKTRRHAIKVVTSLKKKGEIGSVTITENKVIKGNLYAYTGDPNRLIPHDSDTPLKLAVAKLDAQLKRGGESHSPPNDQKQGGSEHISPPQGTQDTPLVNTVHHPSEQISPKENKLIELTNKNKLIEKEKKKKTLVSSALKKEKAMDISAVEEQGKPSVLVDAPRMTPLDIENLSDDYLYQTLYYFNKIRSKEVLSKTQLLTAVQDNRYQIISVSEQELPF